MPIFRLNHAVLYVRDLERSVAFYRDALGFEPVMRMPGAAFVQAPGSTNDHDLGLFQIGTGAGPSEAGRRTVGLYDLAWEVDTLAELERLAARLAEAGALAGASDHGTTRACTPRTPTASSSRSPGWSRPTCWTPTPWPPASGSAPST